MSTDNHWATDACTLPSEQQPLREAEFAELFAASLRSVERVAPTRLRLLLDAAARAETVRLTEAESSCCSFFTFTIGEAAQGRIGVDIDVPRAQVPVLDGLARQASALVRP